jgi:hypothetical protein
LFGGNGPLALTSLDAYSVYETLIPHNGTLFNFSADGRTARNIQLENGQFAFLSGAVHDVPEPPAWSLMAAGIALLGCWRRLAKRRGGSAV